MHKLTSLETDSMTRSRHSEYENRDREQARERVEIEADLCKGCLLCIEACPPGVLVMSKSLNKMGYHPAGYVGERCTACGVCFYICPEPGSIRVYKRKKNNETQETLDHVSNSC